MKPVKVYTESETFKYGWTAGFYDAKPEESRRYLDDVLRYGVRSADDASFVAGHRAGYLARLQLAARSDEPPVIFRPAA